MSLRFLTLFEVVFHMYGVRKATPERITILAADIEEVLAVFRTDFDHPNIISVTQVGSAYVDRNENYNSEETKLG